MTDAELLFEAEALSGIGAWAWDLSSDRLQWSAQTFRLHGLAPAATTPTLEEALQQIADHDRPRVVAAWRLAAAQQGVLDIRYWLQQPAGDDILVRCQARWQPSPSPAGRLLGTLQAVAQPRAAAALLGEPLEFAVAAAGVGVWEIDVDTGQEIWSDLTLAMYGLPPGSPAPTRQQWREQFLHPDDHARVDAQLAQTLDRGATYVMDYRIRRAGDGALRWLHTRAAFAFGGRSRIWGVTLDITDRRQAEDRASQAARLLDLAATHVGFGFGYREAGGETGEWSPQLKRLFGLAPEAPTPHRSELVQLVSERDRARVMTELTTPIPPGGVSEFEFEVQRGVDGQPRTLMTRAVTPRDEQGRADRTYFAIVDLTTLRQQDRRLQDVLERLQLAADASGLGTWEQDEATGRVHWDAITLAHFGLPADASAPDFGQYLELVHPEDRARVREEWDRVEDQGGTIDIEFRVQLPGQGERWLRSRGRVERFASGRPQRRIGVCFDTTARRQAETSQQARVLAERSNAAKTEFLSRMSHELRTPLNAVLGFAQLLSLDQVDPLSDSQRQRVDHIQTAGWHLLALVNDVLDLTQIESRQTQMAFSWIDLAEVVHECMAMTAPLAQKRLVTQAWLAEPGTPSRVWADRTRLRQVLLNLLSNAVKYNREHGQVQVLATAMPSGELQVQVRDTGLGLTPQQLLHLFEPFNRLGRESTGVEGTGIGLALSRLIVEQMGGRIWAYSEPGQGCVFSVALPGVAAA